MLTFIKDYKANESLRLSFDQLAKETFGISFETWYQENHWNEKYIPYSFHDEGKVVANVSANLMTLIIDSFEVNAIQIGTVMTDPAYRRRGLAFELFQKIFEDFDTTTTLYYLAAEPEAMSLYERCGFKEVPVMKYSVQRPNKPYTKPSAEPSNDTFSMLKPVEMTFEALLDWKKKSTLKGGRFDVINDEHVLAFYWFHGFDKKLYTLGEETLILADFSDDAREIVLYDCFNRSGHSLSEVIDLLWHQTAYRFDTIRFAFDVTGLPIDLESQKIQSSSWMERAHKSQHLPAEFCYPKISQT